MTRSFTPDEVKAALHGALAFPITPFNEDGSVDYAAVSDNTRFLATSGISAIVAPSGTGEFFALTPEEAIGIVKATVAAAGDKPVIAAAGFGPTLGSWLARESEAAGAAAIMVVPPYYAKPEANALIDYIADIAAGTSLPIIPYARDAALFTPKMVEQLVEMVPSTIAFKDGRADVRLFQQIREYVVGKLGPDRLVWLGGSGDDLVGPYFAAGAVGYTSSLACFWPEASKEIYDLVSSGNYAGLAEFHARVVQPIYAMRQRRPGYEVSVMKAAMEELGHKAGPARPPLANVTEEEREELRTLLRELKVPTAADRAAVPA